MRMTKDMIREMIRECQEIVSRNMGDTMRPSISLNLGCSVTQRIKQIKQPRGRLYSTEDV